RLIFPITRWVIFPSPLPKTSLCKLWKWILIGMILMIVLFRYRRGILQRPKIVSCLLQISNYFRQCIRYARYGFDIVVEDDNRTVSDMPNHILIAFFRADPRIEITG